VWVLDLRSKKTSIIHPQALSSFLPAWSPDGNQLAFYSDQDGVLGLWVWKAQDGRTERVTPTIARPGQIDGPPVWIDKRKILAKFLPQGMTLETVKNAVYPPTPAP